MDAGGLTECVNWSGRRDRDGYGRAGGLLAHGLCARAQLQSVGSETPQGQEREERQVTDEIKVSVTSEPDPHAADPDEDAETTTTTETTTTETTTEEPDDA